MFDFGLFAALLVLGYSCGRIAERRHYQSIRKRESELADLPAIATKFPPRAGLYQQQLVCGSVVIGSDYFKSFMAGLVNLFGGRVRAFESLLDRGRRESLLRLKEQAGTVGASMVINVKYETSSIAAGVTTIEVLAYGTALTPLGDSTVQQVLPD